MSWTPDLSKVTESETALETAHRTAVSGQTPAGGPTRARLRARPRPAQGAGWPVLRAVAVGERDGVWSQPPTPVASVVRYAATGEWATPGRGGLRPLACLYAGLVGITVTVVLYGVAWLIQRPVHRPRPATAPAAAGPGARRRPAGVSRWAVPPPALADLVVDALRGSWCPPAATVRLAAGRAYCLLIVLPVSAGLYLLAAVAQRPGRLAAAAVLLLIIRIFL